MNWPPVSALCVCAILAPRFGWSQDVVWDPSEIARMAEQAAQLSLAFSTTIEMGLQTAKLAQSVGVSGPRGAPSLPGFASLSLSPAAPSQSPRQSAVNAAIDGYALAMRTNQDLTLASHRAEQLTAQAAAAADARADVQANSAVCLAILAELTSIQGLLALSLQQRSARAGALP